MNSDHDYKPLICLLHTKVQCYIRCMICDQLLKELTSIITCIMLDIYKHDPYCHIFVLY